ncbi:podocalyxin isoform X2 [Pristis pectinata]|uniref:podocalyxin isoform X2 n=1 Tax=Pristis pectinata TaxID=685728 RepID=UPI00223E1C57|nr:podocalyxin isoform X2 [Pristis pectinata]
MRLLLLLSFLGVRPIISSSPSPATSKINTQSHQSQSSDADTGTALVNNIVPGKGNSSMENNTAATTSSWITPSPSPSATQESAQSGTMKQPSIITPKQTKSEPSSIVLTSPVSTASQKDGNGTAVEPTNASTSASPESNSKFVSSTSVSSSQDTSTFSSKPTSTPRSNTSPEIQSTSTERISPTTAIEHTERKSDTAVTSAAGSVQTTMVNETWVKNSTDSMEKNTTSGTFTDSTGSTEKSAPRGTQRNTTEVTYTTEAMKTATEALPKEKTQEPKERNTILSEVYCVAESSNQQYHVKIDKGMDCETFVEGKGKDLAKQICSHLAKKGDLKMFDKCVVHVTPQKEHQSDLIINVVFKVNDDQMNEVQKILQEFEMNKVRGLLAKPGFPAGVVVPVDGLCPLLSLGIQEHEGSKEQQTATELKKLIAMVVTGSLLLLVFLSAIVYRCSQRKYKHKDPYLTEELRTVDNGCHDNPAMDITERDSEMEEKNNSKATFLENTDGWIVPMDTHIKDELEEEDTHL